MEQQEENIKPRTLLELKEERNLLLQQLETFNKNDDDNNNNRNNNNKENSDCPEEIKKEIDELCKILYETQTKHMDFLATRRQNALKRIADSADIKKMSSSSSSRDPDDTLDEVG